MPYFYAYYVAKTLTAMVSEGAMMCLSLAYVADKVPEAQRAAAFGVFSGVCIAGFVAGTIVARFLYVLVFPEGAIPLYQEPVCKFAAYFGITGKFLTVYDLRSMQLTMMPLLAPKLGEQKLLVVALLGSCVHGFLYSIAWSFWVPYLAASCVILSILVGPCLVALIMSINMRPAEVQPDNK
ncbi:hypothetical protein ACQ4PT_033910 [Festuca glaucescens]